MRRLEFSFNDAVVDRLRRLAFFAQHQGSIDLVLWTSRRFRFLLLGGRNDLGAVADLSFAWRFAELVRRSGSALMDEVGVNGR